MTLTQTAIALGVIVTTVGTSVIIRPTWSAKVQSYVALGLSIVLGAAAAAQQGAFDKVDWRNTQRILQAVGVVYAASQVAFHGIWKPTGAASAVEAATTPAGAPPKLSRDEVLIAGVARAITDAIAAERAKGITATYTTSGGSSGFVPPQPGPPATS